MYCEYSERLRRRKWAVTVRLRAREGSKLYLDVFRASRKQFRDTIGCAGYTLQSFNRMVSRLADIFS
jgi:hypothetical protein